MSSPPKHTTSDILDDLETRFAKSDEAGATEGRKRNGPTGYIAKVIASSNDDLAAEAARAREELRALHERMADGGTMISVAPARVRRSAFADRHPAAFAGREFRAFLEEIRSTGGNELPGCVRPVTGDPDHDYELASGHRRHAACLASGLPFKAIVKRMSDVELVEHMRLENRDRKDLSDFELGKQYASLLQSRVYRSARQMAAAMGEGRERMRRLLLFGQLPDALVAIFPDPRRIRVQWLPGIIAALSSDPDLVSRTTDAAKSGTPWPAERIFRFLTNARGTDFLTDSDGRTVATLRSVHGRRCITLRKDAPQSLIAAIEDIVSRYYSESGNSGSDGAAP